MKQLSLLLALLGFSCGLYVQQTPFFTMQELRQLMACPTPECFKEAVRKKGYELHRKETTDGLTILTYHILTEGQNPAYPLHLITYGYKGPSDGRTVGFLTKSPSFPAWLDAELAEAGYMIDGPNNPAENRIYTRQEGAVRWRLSRYKPEYSPSAGGNSYQINLSGFRLPAPSPTTPVAQQPSYTPPLAENSELPHLGGDWDKNYPVQNADDLFRAERAYAADYERKHGKTGHTFSRAEKLRIQATYLNQLRPLTDDRWEKSFDLALRTTGFEAFANERRRLFKQEALFGVAGERVWLPTQEVLIASLQKEATRNVPITLYSVLTSHHDFGGTLHLSFLVNEFAAPKEQQKPAEESPYAHLINQPSASNTVVNDKAKSSGCGFDWKSCDNLSADEKAALKQVLVLGEASNEDLLQHISSIQRDQGKAQIAKYDFSGNGHEDYVILLLHMQYPDEQQPRKRAIGFIEVIGDLGKRHLKLNVVANYCAIKPAMNGIIDESGKFLRMREYPMFDQSYGLFLDFRSFIIQYATDKKIQLEQTKFPIIWNEYANGITKKRVSIKSNWKHENVLKSSGEGYEVFVSYPSLTKPNDAYVGETCKGGDCGYGAGLGFKKINRLWYCTSKIFGSD